MKKLLFIICIAISFTSCTFKTNYELRSLESWDHDQHTNLTTTEEWHRGDVVYVAGHAYQVIWVNY